jgi:hypothetical protein
MTLDARARPTASFLLDKFGKSITYTRAVPGVYDPATRTVGTTETSLTVKASVQGTSTAQRKDMTDPGELVVLIAGMDLEFAPAMGHKLTVDGVVFTICEEPQATYSGELVALWTCKAKK